MCSNKANEDKMETQPEAERRQVIVPTIHLPSRRCTFTYMNMHISTHFALDFIGEIYIHMTVVHGFPHTCCYGSIGGKYCYRWGTRSHLLMVHSDALHFKHPTCMSLPCSFCRLFPPIADTLLVLLVLVDAS